MITVYDAVGGKLVQRDQMGDLSTSVWIDLIEPKEDEDKFIEQALGIEVPTRSEMREIEASNRFYTDNGAYYMSSFILHNSELG
ncbi:MAG: magnesium transporter CorA, partial [Hyphomicrobium sp.]|nr:magnesium transporter CorA [Hyphomicrobium sp.]